MLKSASSRNFLDARWFPEEGELPFPKLISRNWVGSDTVYRTPLHPVLFPHRVLRYLRLSLGRQQHCHAVRPVASRNSPVEPLGRNGPSDTRTPAPPNHGQL